MLNFNIPEKGMGLVSPPHFVYDFSRKMFLMLHSITKFHSLIAFTLRYWVIYVLKLFVNQAMTS